MSGSKIFLQQVLALLAKDLKTEWRTREIFTSMIASQWASGAHAQAEGGLWKSEGVLVRVVVQERGAGEGGKRKGREQCADCLHARMAPQRGKQKGCSSGPCWLLR
jgi:hypothetical protein